MSVSFLVLNIDKLASPSGYIYIYVRLLSCNSLDVEISALFVPPIFYMISSTFSPTKM